MKAVILAGGLGTRLREETEFRPKPMVEVGGKPILWHIMKIFARYGITDFVICVGYRGNIIKRYFLDYEALNNDFTIHLGSKHEITFHGAHLESEWCVTVVDTGHDTNTGGRIKQAQPFIGDDTFLVTYGDGLSDVDVTALLDFHKNHGKLATVTTVQPPTRFGIVHVDQDSSVDAFREKPKTADWVSAGFFVFDQEVFAYLDGDSVLEAEPLEALTKDRQLMAYHHPGFWQPVDTYRELTMLNELWATGEAPWRIWAS